MYTEEEQQAYDGLETDLLIIEALEYLAGESMLYSDNTLNDESESYAMWRDGGCEEEVIAYLDVNYPDWKENPCYWGSGGDLRKWKQE